MITRLLEILRWYLSLSRKFLQVVPAATTLVVLATLVSQVSKILAFFLPLKVMILLGSDRIPRYFPPVFAEFDRDVLIVSLCVATVVFYGLHLLAERVIVLGTDYGSGRLLEKSRKLTLFENQDELAANGYQQYSQALASSVFVVLSLLVLGWYYREIALLIIAFSAFVAGTIWLLQRLNSGFRESLENRLNTLVKTAGAVGFLLVFAYLVADFVLWSQPGLLLAIIALLLSRQSFNRAAGAVSNVGALNRQRPRLDALYFHGKVLMPDQRGADKSMWPVLMPERRAGWIREVLAEFGIEADDDVVCRWHQLGVINVAALRCYLQDTQSGYLIKLFEANRTSAARHEATLLTRPPRGLPALKLLGATQAGQFHCHVFALPPGHEPDNTEVPELAMRLKAELIAVSPSAKLVERYVRSRPMLWQRLAETQFERLRLAADAESLQLIEAICGNLDNLRSRLQALPLTFVNPPISKDTVWMSDDGVAALLHWGQWRLEPLGASWPVQKKPLAELPRAIAAAAAVRATLAEVEPAHAELAALAQVLEVKIQQQRYTDALMLLPRILERL